MLVRLACVVLACVGTRLAAQSLVIPDAETAYPPTPDRITLILAAAQRDGWPPQAAPLRSAALRAYAGGNLTSADAWFHLYAWARLLGEPGSDFTPRWIAAVNAAKVAHANMPRTFAARSTPLGAALSPETQRWLLGNAAFSQEFFALLSPVDYVPRVFEILDTLYRADPARFARYAHLALAIAVVYDVPPPPFWPHGQVPENVLPRKLPLPTEAFAWWVRQDALGRMYHPLRTLPADEAKFVVDTAAPFAELEWAQQTVATSLDRLPDVYRSVRYRMDRINLRQAVWPGRTYRLVDVLATGGICADQAYFATEVGKAHGVPTLLFTGAGNDGWHAWFGYLQADGTWRLDAGRYADQRFVTGFARDPQTWRELSDHELQFLSERFHARDSYRLSSVHEEFAADLLAAGRAGEAAAAARNAVKFEPRNQAGWETLIEAQEKLGDSRSAEVTLREAALAFQRYPDLEAGYVARVAESLRARGQTSEADAELRRIARKNRDTRFDLSVQTARDAVQRAIMTEPLDGQIRAYNSALETYGSGAGAGFFQNVVVGFVEHLLELRHKPEALRALSRARETLSVQPGSQLEREFEKLQTAIAAAK